MTEEPGTFWDEVEKEYENLWREWWSEEVAYSLGHLILEDGAKYIMEDEKLDNASKARLLKAYAKELKEFADVVKQALQNKKPLSSTQLYKWFEKLTKVYPSRLYEYVKDAEYYLDYYDMYNDQLETLSLLSQYIERALRTIEQNYLPEL
ncbi:MAG: hypothetical protein JHC23_00940, partial [Sulfolobus sp.]|nr:hypothetical protein [Sulfolobus sp.]